MRAILIDPAERRITEVNHEGDLNSIRNHIFADLVDAVRLENGDVIYVDDEGLLKPGQAVFIINSGRFSHQIAGRGLVVGTGEYGNDLTCKSTRFDIARALHFTNQVTA